jgi:hypothetical protein
MHPALGPVTSIFAWLIPGDFREPLVGNLAEEYSRQAKIVSRYRELRRRVGDFELN